MTSLAKMHFLATVLSTHLRDVDSHWIQKNCCLPAHISSRGGIPCRRPRLPEGAGTCWRVCCTVRPTWPGGSRADQDTPATKQFLNYNPCALKTGIGTWKCFLKVARITTVITKYCLCENKECFFPKKIIGQKTQIFVKLDIKNNFIVDF